MNVDISQIEALIHEYTKINNSERAKELEQQIDSFADRFPSLLDYLGIIRHQTSSDTQFFVIQSVDRRLVERWTEIDLSARIAILSLTFEFYTTNFISLPHHVLNSALKLILDIVLRDWPDNIPDFMNSGIQLFHSPGHALAGIFLFTYISDEFSSPSQKSVVVARSRELFTSYIPEIIGCLTQILNLIYDKKIDDQKLLISCFRALQSYFSWAPLDEILQPVHVSVILKYIELSNNISLYAFNCIIEIMGRKYVPIQTSSVLLEMFNSIFSMIQSLESNSALQNLDEEFLVKFNLFIRFFVENHMTRSTDFPLLQFAYLFKKYTIGQTSLESYLECLSIWELFLDFLKVQDEINPDFKQQYYDVISGLCQELITESQFRTNFHKLSKFDNPNDTEDPEENELRNFLANALNIIQLSVSLYPNELVALILPGLNSVQQIIEGNYFNETLSTEHMYYTILDAGTILRLTGAVSDPFVYNFALYFESGVTLMRSLNLLANYYYQNELYKRDITRRLIIDVHEAMKSLSPWLNMFCASLTNDTTDIFHELIIGNLTSIYFSLNTNMSNIMAASSEHFQRFATSVKYPSLFSLEEMSKILSLAGPEASKYPLETQKNFYSGVVNLILVSWVGSSTQSRQWVQNPISLNDYLSFLVYRLLEGTQGVQNTHNSIDPNSIALVSHNLNILTELIKSAEECKITNQGRETLISALQNTYAPLATIIPLIPAEFDVLVHAVQYLKCSIAMFGKLFPTNLTSEYISAFFTLFERQQNSNTLPWDRVTELMTQFLDLLTTITDFHKCPLLENITSFALNNLYPLIQPQDADSRLENGFYKLLRSIMIHHYEILSSDGNFQKIFACLENCLSRYNNIECFKLVLKLIRELVQKRKLCSNMLFAQNYYGPFVYGLLTTLWSGWVEILNEDIITTLFTIVEGSGFDTFYNGILPSYIQEKLNVNQIQKDYIISTFNREQDLPSFTRNMNLFSMKLKSLLRSKEISFK